MRWLLTSSMLLAAGCAGHHEGHGPAGIPYRCGAEQLRVVYLDGGWTMRARARLSYRGETTELRAAPAAEGLRYEGRRAARDVVWQVSGERAELGEYSFSGGDILLCTRARDDGAAAPAAEAPDHH